MVLTLVDRLAAPLADAHLAAVGELLDPDADGPIAAAAHEEHGREGGRARRSRRAGGACERGRASRSRKARRACERGPHQMTSGASEMIFVNCRSRSSRATGPKIRVPTGFSSGLMSTTALRSKRMYDPSLRRTSFTVRTTTARATSPFFTVPSGAASFTATITVSPREA